MRNSFYELRRSNDFQPYYCCELNEEKRKEFLNHKDELFLLLDHEKLIASVGVHKNGYIDDLFVLPACQGKGYGKKALQFAMNKALAYGNKRISLNAIEWNTAAVSLYLSIGFQIEQKTCYYRLFLD